MEGTGQGNREGPPAEREDIPEPVHRSGQGIIAPLPRTDDKGTGFLPEAIPTPKNRVAGPDAYRVTTRRVERGGLIAHRKSKTDQP